MQYFLDLFVSINCSTCFRTLLLPAAIVDEIERSSISSTIAAGSSIGLTIPDAVCSFVLLMMGGETA
jgi:hypothetical protein